MPSASAVYGNSIQACMYGNMEMLQARICDLLLLGDELTLQACTEQELSAQTFNGETCLGRISLSFTPLRTAESCL